MTIPHIGLDQYVATIKFTFLGPTLVSTIYATRMKFAICECSTKDRTLFLRPEA